MVYEYNYERPTMPYYQNYQQNVPMPYNYNGMYDDYSFYYQPNIYQAQMMGGGYFPPYANVRYMPAYQQAESYTPNTYLDSTGEETASASTSKVMQQFLDENGQVDIQKMLQTVGQFADTVQQVSPVIKQLNDLVRSFRA